MHHVTGSTVPSRTPAPPARVFLSQEDERLRRVRAARLGLTPATVILERADRATPPRTIRPAALVDDLTVLATAVGVLAGAGS